MKEYCFAIKFILLIAIFLALLQVVEGVEASEQIASLAMDLTYMTEQFPPYNFKEDGELQGFSIDLLEAMWRIMGVDLNRSIIEVLPWREGYERTLNKENTVLFSTARLPQREQLFKWAGPIGPFNNVLISRSDRNPSIVSPGDLLRYRIGAIKDDSAVQMLRDMGVREGTLVLEPTARPIIEMLQNRSIDAWAYGDVAGFWLIQESGANGGDFEVAYVLGQADYYYAFHKKTPDSLVRSFQEAIDYLKNNTDSDSVSDYVKIISNTY